MRLFSSPKRDQQPVDEAPPEGILLLGAGGLVVGIVARSIGGAIGTTLADLGRATTGTGAFVLIRWLYPRTRKERG